LSSGLKNNNSIDEKLPFKGRETAGYLKNVSDYPKNGKHASSFTNFSGYERNLTFNKPPETKKPDAIISTQLNFK